MNEAWAVPIHQSIPLKCLVAVTGIVSLILGIRSVPAVTVAPQEMSQSRRWVATGFEAVEAGKVPSLPFSFVYGGRPSAEVIKDWKFERTAKRLDGQRTERTLLYTDPQTGLVVRCVAVEFHDFPAAEWTLYFRNTGSSDTPILTDIRALDVQFNRDAGGEFVLNHNKGDVTEAGFNYEPLRTVLEPKTNLQLSATVGFPCQGSFPYFNVEWHGKGVVMAVGWPGQWAAQFIRDDTTGLRITAGQQFARFTLQPDEEVRSPRIVVLHWQGDFVRAQNLWRRWMIAHNMPHPGGKPLQPLLAASNSDLFGYTGMTEENQIQFIDRYVEEKIPIDLWWVDAGWYSVPEGMPWWNYGTWEYDRKRFPNGLKPVMDHARSKDLKTLLWLCPEPVRPKTDLRLKHPEWLLGPEGHSLLYLGNPEAWTWLVEHADALIRELQLDIYRTDNDVGGLDYWRNHDPADRLGITEIRHLTGLMNYYDELQRRHPNLLIDNCCAGGRRNDVEMMRRAVPLWRSDFWSAPLQMQCQTYGLAMWIPFFGHMSGHIDAYVFRSNMFPSGVMGVDMRNRNQDFDLLRRLIGQLRQIAPYYLGDYYPLTPYRKDNDAWMAWQFDVPEKGQGMVQAFRRAASSFFGRQLKLQGLEPAATYALANLDVYHKAKEFTGQQLMEQGLSIDIPDQPDALIMTYRKLE